MLMRQPVLIPSVRFHVPVMMDTAEMVSHVMKILLFGLPMTATIGLLTVMLTMVISIRMVAGLIFEDQCLKLKLENSELLV